MSNVNIASSAADAEAADKVEQHHAEMAGRLDGADRELHLVPVASPC